MKIQDRLRGITPADAQMIMRGLSQASAMQRGAGGAGPYAGTPWGGLPMNAQLFGAVGGMPGYRGAGPGLLSPLFNQPEQAGPAVADSGPPLPPMRPQGLPGVDQPPPAMAFASAPAAPPAFQPPPASGPPMPPQRPPEMGASPAGGLLQLDHPNMNIAQALNDRGGMTPPDPNQGGLLDLMKAQGMGQLNFPLFGGLFA